MKTRLVETITTNEDSVRLRIFDGEIPLSEAQEDLIRMYRAQRDAAEQRLAEYLISRERGR